MTSPFPTPALDTWRRELTRGARTTQSSDALSLAACWDAAAVNADPRSQPASVCQR